MMALIASIAIGDGFNHPSQLAMSLLTVVACHNYA
jgi:hypothetical protein